MARDSGASGGGVAGPGLHLLGDLLEVLLELVGHHPGLLEALLHDAEVALDVVLQFLNVVLHELLEVVEALDVPLLVVAVLPDRLEDLVQVVAELRVALVVGEPPTSHSFWWRVACRATRFLTAPTLTQHYNA